MRLKPPRVGEIIAGAAGAVLALTLFLPWYGSTGPRAGGPGAEGDETGFEAFAVLDVLLVILALAGIGLLAAEIVTRAPAVPVAWAALTALLGLAATVWVLVAVLAPPGSGAEPLFALLGLAATAGVTVGAFLSMRDEGFGLRPKPGLAPTLSHAAAAAPEPLPAPDPAGRRHTSERS